MGLSRSLADGIAKFGYSAEWLDEHRRVIREFREGDRPREQVVTDARALRGRKPFKEPENFLQAYYNAHYWSNRAKEEGDKRLYRKKDEAIIRALDHLNYEGIKPIRPEGHPGLLEIQVPSHDVLLHTYNPRIKRMIVESGYSMPVEPSPAEPYLHERRLEIARRKMLEKTRGGLTSSSKPSSILGMSRKPAH